MKNSFFNLTTGYCSLTTIGIVCVLLLTVNCRSDNASDRSSVQGTWSGDLDSNRLAEYKVYSPAIEDSMTKLVDSVYTIHNVLVNFSKEEAQFWGMRSVLSAPHLYRWEERDTILFQRKGFDNKSAAHTSVTATIMPYAVIRKLDKDSLVMKLHVYDRDWKQYLLKLKRK